MIKVTISEFRSILREEFESFCEYYEFNQASKDTRGFKELKFSPVGVAIVVNDAGKKVKVVMQHAPADGGGQFKLVSGDKQISRGPWNKAADAWEDFLTNAMTKGRVKIKKQLSV